MIILEHPLEDTIAIIGVQYRNNDIKYRLMNLCIINDEPEGKVIYNGLTKAAVLLTQEDWEEIQNDKKSKYDFLYYSYFLVPEDYDEAAVADSYRNVLRGRRTCSIETPRNFTILPTTSCNARCFYCYEKGCAQKVMTKETAAKVGDFIINHHEMNAPVRIHWFGGEPTVNTNAINIICKKLRDKHIEYFSEMTSNGYLLNKKNLNDILNVWRLRSVQITIDGTEKVYNKAKNYIYDEEKTGSPYQIVLDNIGMLLSNNIRVSIRLNVDKHNATDLIDLIHIIHQRYNKHRQLSIYAMPLFECAMVEKRTQEEREQVYKWVSDIYDLLNELGYVGSGLERGLYNTMCFADDGKSLLIAPGGEIGLCEHHTDDEFIAHIDDPTYDYEMVHKWEEQMKKLPICQDCPFWPDCIKLTHCAEQFSCSKEEKDLKIKKVKMHLANYFKNAKTSPYYLQQKKEEADKNSRNIQDSSRNELIASDITINNNGVYVAPQNMLYHTIITNVYSDFMCFRYKKALYIYYIGENMDDYGTLTTEDMFSFITENTNLKDFNIQEDEIELTQLKGDFELEGCKISLLKHHDLKRLQTLEWSDTKIYNGNIEVKQGNTKIIEW